MQSNCCTQFERASVCQLHQQKLSVAQAAETVVQAAKQELCPRVAVAGSKGTGKSTMARLLVNSLLNVTPVVAFLDTDCGQAELTVPGISCVVHSYLRSLVLCQRAELGLTGRHAFGNECA